MYARNPTERVHKLGCHQPGLYDPVLLVSAKANPSPPGALITNEKLTLNPMLIFWNGVCNHAHPYELVEADIIICVPEKLENVEHKPQVPPPRAVPSVMGCHAPPRQVPVEHAEHEQVATFPGLLYPVPQAHLEGALDPPGHEYPAGHPNVLYEQVVPLAGFA